MGRKKGERTQDARKERFIKREIGFIEIRLSVAVLYEELRDGSRRFVANFDGD